MAKEISSDDMNLGNTLCREISSLITLRTAVEVNKDKTDGGRSSVSFIIVLTDDDDPKRFTSRSYCTRAGATRLLNNRRSLVAFTKNLLAFYAVGRFYEVAF